MLHRSKTGGTSTYEHLTMQFLRGVISEGRAPHVFATDFAYCLIKTRQFIHVYTLHVHEHNAKENWPTMKVQWPSIGSADAFACCHKTNFVLAK